MVWVTTNSQTLAAVGLKGHRNHHKGILRGSFKARVAKYVSQNSKFLVVISVSWTLVKEVYMVKFS